MIHLLLLTWSALAANHLEQLPAGTVLEVKSDFSLFKNNGHTYQGIYVDGVHAESMSSVGPQSSCSFEVEESVALASIKKDPKNSPFYPYIDPRDGALTKIFIKAGKWVTQSVWVLQPGKDATEMKFSKDGVVIVLKCKLGLFPNSGISFKNITYNLGQIFSLDLSRLNK